MHPDTHHHLYQVELCTEGHGTDKTRFSTCKQAERHAENVARTQRRAVTISRIPLGETVGEIVADVHPPAAGGVAVNLTWAGSRIA